ncbi:uncharacterized protein M6B38_327295 [Iris pallida]|uniref:CCHC-type domain-containing protein n=1 Tax=Iris pallida TaxID=29817 RepID=A0AAX6H663_IRIPA|nr:uncharacterized protein M6B38_327295 [Iris pallida]
MLEKIYTSFHEKDAILMQQYRERKFTKYSELHSTLMMAEQNRELLLATHNLRPAGSAPLPEAHFSSKKQKKNKDRSNMGNAQKRPARSPPKNNFHPQSSKSGAKKKWKKTTELMFIPKKNWEDKCHKCGMTGHWSRNCRTPRHLQDLYQASQKSQIETNLVEKQPSTQFSAEDFENDDLLD